MKKKLLMTILGIGLSTTLVCGKPKPLVSPDRYMLYENKGFIHTFRDRRTPMCVAEKYQNPAIIDLFSPSQPIVQKPRFIVENIENNLTFSHHFIGYGEASRFACEKNSSVIHISTKTIVYKCEKELPNPELSNTSVQLTVPLIKQKPELPRGCEVVSLAMMLHHAGVSVDKMQLANQIRQNPRPWMERGGVTYFGDPDNGFVGDMYSLVNPGLGVYSHPVYELAVAYLGEQALHMTGAEFDTLLYQLRQGYPVWVLTNAKYQPLQPTDYETWHTESGEIQISRWMHSVLVTGYDDRFIYFNDPLGKQTQAPRQRFREAWEQMGRQAISYVYPPSQASCL